MKRFLALAGMMAAFASIAAENTWPSGTDVALQKIVDQIAAETLKTFASNQLSSNQLAFTLVQFNEAGLRVGSYRGEKPIYPASVVKLFYLAAAHRWMEDGKLKDTAELRRALRDMIVESSNDATHYVLDVLTDTTSGPELSEAETKLWGEKRNVVNRYFASLGYTNINANQKPWCEGPYGRDRVWVGTNYQNRNSLTTDATARLLAEIATGRCISTDRSGQMMKLLARDQNAKTSDADDQAHGFTALGLPREAKLWSKAGWTSSTRHDAAYVELADGRKFALVTFTAGHANEREIIAFVARRVVQRLP